MVLGIDDMLAAKLHMNSVHNKITIHKQYLKKPMYLNKHTNKIETATTTTVANTVRRGTWYSETI